MKRKLFWGLSATVAGYALLYDLGRRWGATDEEIGQPLPGDELVSQPNLISTHAITIEAGPADIWPWLVQVGFGRAQWYTDAWWDPLIARFALPLTVPEADLPKEGIPRSADRIVPEWQNLAVGDVIPDGPPDTAWFRVEALEPERAMVLFSDSHIRYVAPTFLHNTRWATNGEFTWSFVLQPAGPKRTRLILRMRGTVRPRMIGQLGQFLFYPLDFLFVRQMLGGIKKRVERTAQKARR
jgi:hypothetical protein